jgi:LPXTG-motif cell wall-anchored protein
MNLRKYVSLLISLIVLTSLFSMSTASVSAFQPNWLDVSISKYNPSPAQIGEYVDVWVKVDNVGQGKVEDVSIEIVPEYPLSLDSPNNAVKKIGILNPDSSAEHKYRLYIDENAKPSTSEITIRYRGEGESWIEQEFEISIGTDTYDSIGIVQLENIQSEPEVMMPGDTGTISFTLKNTASQRTVKIGDEIFENNVRIQRATLHGCDRIDVESESYHGGGLLGPGDSMEISYNINVDENAEAGTCYLDLSMQGSIHAYNNNWRIPVKIESSSVKVIPSEQLRIENGEGTLEFDVANVRPNALSSVNVELQAEGVEFSPSPYFIGTMNPDELFTIEVDTSVISDNLTGTRELMITANYRNGMNEHENVVATKELKLVTNDEQPSNIAAIGGILVIVAGAIAFVIYRRRKNKNQ